MIHFDAKLDYCNVSLGEYIELQDVLLNNEEGLEQQDLVMHEIQILYDRDPYRMTLPEFKKAVESLTFMSKEMPKMKVRDSYMLNGNKYNLHKELSDFKVAHYVDYQMIMQNKKGIENYPQFIALFLIPDGHDYNDGYNMQTAVNDIRNYLSIADATSIAGFFLRSSKIYTVLSLWYSMWTTRKAIKNRKTRRLLRKKTMQLMNLVLNGD